MMIPHGSTIGWRMGSEHTVHWIRLMISRALRKASRPLLALLALLALVKLGAVVVGGWRGSWCWCWW